MLKPLLYIDRSQHTSRRKKTMLPNELPYDSVQKGGTRLGYADGSVHFLNDEINYTTFQALSTKDSGEVVELP